MKYSDYIKIKLRTTRGHKILGVKCLFVPRFSHQSLLNLDSKVAPQSATFHIAKLCATC